MKKDKFVNRLNERLKMIDMSAAQLSRATGISEPVISQYRSGKYEPKQDRIEAFAIALNVSEAWLRGYDVPMERTADESDDTHTDPRFSKEDSDLAFALWGDSSDIDEKDIEEVKRFAAFIKEKKK